MSRLGRVGRRPDHWSSPHERARSRAAERLDSALHPDEAAWLDAHVAECDACRIAADAYVADRTALRALRQIPIEPPRDLWARTAAGIEREAAGHRAGRRPTRAGRGFPVGAMAGLAVIAVVVGTSLMAGRWFDRPSGGSAAIGAVASASPVAIGPTTPPAPTPMAVNSTSVAWVGANADGVFAYNVAPVDHVCAVDDQPGCAALDDHASRPLTLPSQPKSVIGSPKNGQAVVVASDGNGQERVIVLSLPGRTPTPSATPSASPSDSPTPTPTPTDSAGPSGTPSVTPPATPTPTPTATPTATPTPTDSAGPTDSATPTESASPTDSAEPTPTVSPEPSVALELAIADGVTIVGESAAFSADGQWFAFSARPADATAGPDIYVWHVGDAKAHKVTTDGVSIFASWAGGLIVGSRPVGDDLGDGSHQVTSFLIDPIDGTVQELGVPLWRPAVDPTGRYALAWDGTVIVAANGIDVRPGVGSLRLLSWPIDPTAVEAHGSPLDELTGIQDFDIRWDETGGWLAVWVSEPADPTIGRLTLLRLDPTTSEMTHPDGAPTDVPALAGFSIGDGRLAWVTPKGQDAEGSKVHVAAWSDAGVGAVESVPGQDVIVVR